NEAKATVELATPYASTLNSHGRHGQGAATRGGGGAREGRPRRSASRPRDGGAGAVGGGQGGRGGALLRPAGLLRQPAGAPVALPLHQQLHPAEPAGARAAGAARAGPSAGARGLRRVRPAPAELPGARGAPPSGRLLRQLRHLRGGQRPGAAPGARRRRAPGAHGVPHLGRGGRDPGAGVVRRRVPGGAGGHGGRGEGPRGGAPREAHGPRRRAGGAERARRARVPVPRGGPRGDPARRIRRARRAPPGGGGDQLRDHRAQARCRRRARHRRGGARARARARRRAQPALPLLRDGGPGAPEDGGGGRRAAAVLGRRTPASSLSCPSGRPFDFRSCIYLI
uniref:Uncharacterized protein n=1 Tax=Zea mays TaxID=4577 RepID=A0A804QGP4_MAIZE